MNQNPKLNNYVSEIDQVLQHFDEKHSLSVSQQKEKAKYERIYLLRDQSRPAQDTPKIWDKF